MRAPGVRSWATRLDASCSARPTGIGTRCARGRTPNEEQLFFPGQGESTVAGCGNPESQRGPGPSRGAEAPLLHRIRSGAAAMCRP